MNFEKARHLRVKHQRAKFHGSPGDPNYPHGDGGSGGGNPLDEDYTDESFSKWADKNFAPAEKREVRREIHKILENDPELAKSHSWPELESMARASDAPEAPIHSPWRGVDIPKLSGMLTSLREQLGVSKRLLPVERSQLINEVHALSERAIKRQLR